MTKGGKPQERVTMVSFSIIKMSLVVLSLVLTLLQSSGASLAEHERRMEFLRTMNQGQEAGNLRNLHSLLLAKARPTNPFRVLEQDAADDDAMKYNLDNYSLKYTGCQQINTYSDNKAADEDSDNVFALQRFVVFRLCPANHCSSYNSHGCNSNYGEYMIAMEDYLTIMAHYHYSQFDAYCSTCASCTAYEQQQVSYQYKEQHGGRRREMASSNGERRLADDDANNGDDAAANDDQYNGDDGYQGDDAAGDDAYNNGDDAYQGDDAVAYDDAYQQGDDAAANDDAAATGDDQYQDDAAFYAYVDDDYYKDDDSAGGNANGDHSYCRYSSSCYNYQSVCSNYNPNAMDFANYFSCRQAMVGNQYVFIGPHCNGDGFSMTLGVFNDYECSEYLGTIADAQDLTGIDFDAYSLSFYYPKQCISCANQVRHE